MASDEDTIQYWLFPLQENSYLVTDIEDLESFSTLYLTHLHNHTESYIWNHDPFNLKAVKENIGRSLEGYAGVPHLYGETCVGDYIEDEWFITFLLKQLSANFPQLVIRVCDSDGEFLLVEAADHLPSWADPDTADQRVFLCGGHLHLIPPSVVPSPSSDSALPIMEGVTAVTTRPSQTLASPEIQQAINMRIQEYPERVRRDQHVTHVFVPVGVAALLREYPTLLAPAVTAFCSRDSMDNKALRTMRHFPPEQRVLTAVKFSRALYAKMQSRPYFPDAKTGWALPLPNHKDFQQHQLGVKLASGFELLVCNAGGVTPLGSSPSQDVPQSEAPTDTITSNPRWGKYKKTLSDRGYFRGELEGSKLYKELESNALQYFSQHMLKADPSKDSSMDTLSAGTLVVKLLPTVNADLDFFKERQGRLVPADDDSWLTISPELLDEMLENRYGCPDANPASSEQLQAGLETLLSHPSDAEGVEVGSELRDKLRKLSTMSLPRRKTSHVQRKISHAGGNRKVSSATQLRKISSQSCASNASEMSSFSNKVDFNADSFMDAVKGILDMDDVPEDDYWNDSDDDSSGLSSYGDEESTGNSRKISSDSQDSSVSGDSALRSAMRAMEDELRSTTLADSLRSPRIRDAEEEEDQHDEFGDVEDFAPVKVDAAAVKQLVRAYKEEKTAPGPATTLLHTLGMKPRVGD